MPNATHLHGKKSRSTIVARALVVGALVGMGRDVAWVLLGHRPAWLALDPDAIGLTLLFAVAFYLDAIATRAHA